ncbi:MAG: 3-deoxy-manno-octulosonate cytidylyltransferase [Kiritimatiellae bacterium]|nr:3-deoxy-manno-octulosonate cytidylyltransferase [Kiritimatiellia bacterium]MDW8458392.1 3-deoxy-manno-octulosonate cytidylyltransferase [Verrucomicrobiota bacterium]
MRVAIVIPARYGSSRLPGKPLIQLCGKPLIQWVWERARQSRHGETVRIATDDPRIVETVRAFGGECVMTRPDHPSGTDRIAEAVRHLDLDIVVNIQGDEPLIDPGLIDSLADSLAQNSDWDMATAATPIRSEGDLRNPAVVKVVVDACGCALYFSREPIPHVRDTVDPAQILSRGLHRRHLGVYAYRRDFLERLVATPPCELELAEKLEQLRALYIGGRIGVLATEHVGLGVDTPDDIPRAEAALRAQA